MGEGDTFMGKGNADKIVGTFLRQEGVSKNVCRYELKHSTRGRDDTAVETFDITEALTVNELDNLASIIVARAQLDADGIGPSVQRYTLTSYIENSEEPSGRINFRLRGASDVDIDGDSFEVTEDNATSKGLMTQLMRHIEQNNRTMSMTMGAVLTSMARRMESADRTVEKLLSERLQSFEILEEALGRKHEREMESERERAKDQRIAFGMQKVSMLIPVILDKVSGGKSAKSDDPMVMMLGELIESMNTTQLEAIRRSLSAEQQIVFITMLKKFQERKALPSGDSANGTPQKEN
jgi:hypothetical protein